MTYGPRRAGDIRHFDVDNSSLQALGMHFDTDWQATVRDVLAALSALREA